MKNFSVWSFCLIHGILVSFPSVCKLRSFHNIQMKFATQSRCYSIKKNRENVVADYITKTKRKYKQTNKKTETKKKKKKKKEKINNIITSV